MHEWPVAAGDAILVPAGTPHAIGEGILMVEVQEPTDFSIVLEWTGFELTEDQSHLGLGWDRALEDLNREAWSQDRLAELRGRGERLLPEAADPYFRAERVSGGAELEPGFSILIGLEGQDGTLASESGELEFGRGSTVLVPYGAGAAELRGDVTAIRCRPPDPAAGDAPW
jgi:mannose-6-phosphate isomerase